MIFKPTRHTAIPADATIIAKKGVSYARFRKGGKLIEAEVIKPGVCRTETPHYYARIRYPDGRRVRVPLGITDKHAAMVKALQLQEEADRGAAGLRKKSKPVGLPTHVDSYRQSLLNGGTSEKHVLQVYRLLGRITKKLGWKFPSDINREAFEVYLSGRLRSDQVTHNTRNYDLKAYRAFTKWLMLEGYLDVEPLKRIKLLSLGNCPRKRHRKIWSKEEFQAIVAAAWHGERRFGMSGQERAMVYIVAAGTGLRRSELAALKVSDISWEPSPSVRLRSRDSKAKRQDETLPLHPALAEKLLVWLDGRKTGVLFPNFTTRSGRMKFTSRMLAFDAGVAGLEYKTDEGVGDFHSLRGKYITDLCRSCSDFSVIVSLARHSDPKLTAKVYDRVVLEDKAKAVAAAVPPPVV